MIGLTVEAARILDRHTTEDIGLPSAVLMEEAALALYRHLQNLRDLSRSQVLILAGKGNNGGDGLALARLLWNRNLAFRLVMVFGDQELSPEASLQHQVLNNMGVPFETYYEGLDLGTPDIVVDAILGSGFVGSIREPLTTLFKKVNALKAYILSVDVTSGKHGNRPESESDLVADGVLALGYPKWGQLLGEAEKSLVLARLEFPEILVKALGEEGVLHYLSPREAWALLPKRKEDSHKGSYGKVGIYGGRRDMSGAVLLAGKAALMAGSGLVTLFLEDAKSLYGQIPELIVKQWGDFPGTELDVLVVGPGLGRDYGDSLEGYFRGFPGKVLLDADALYLLKEGLIKREWISGEVVLTPHPGEMAMLLGDKKPRMESLEELAIKYQAVVVLKGHRTLIGNGKERWVNLSGNPGMATAGSGDVLGGIIASLMGQGLKPMEAGVLGTYLHGLAGDRGVEERSEQALLAGDLTAFLSKAWLQLQQGSKEGEDLDLYPIY